MAASPCDVLDTLSQYQLDALTQLNKKLVALQRLAQAKADQVQTLIGKMQDLGATVGTPYSVAKAKLNALQTATT